MIPSVRNRGADDGTVAIDLAPLIDVVFILLIFFMVTTSFVQETGIEVERPQASFAPALGGDSLRMVVGVNGAVYVDGVQAGADSVRKQVRTFLQQSPKGTVVLIPDRRTPAEALVKAMDWARSGGATRLALATAREGSP